MYFPVVVIAFASWVILRAPHQQRLSAEEIDRAPPWMRWLIRDPERLHKRFGWATIGWALIILFVRLAPPA